MMKTARIRRLGVFALMVLCFLTAPNLFRNAAAQIIDIPQAPVDVRFHDGIEIFSPQTPVVLEVQPKILFDSESLSNEKRHCLNIAVSKKTKSEEAKNPVTELEIQIPPLPNASWFPVSFLAPIEEGIYEITVSLQRKEERLANNRSLLNFSNNPLQRRSPKTVVETVVHCVVLNPNPIPRLVSSLDSMLIPLQNPPILETVETTGPAWRKHLLPIPSLPKVGHLTSPKLSELPKLTGFRDRVSAKNVAALAAETDSAVAGTDGKPFDVTDQLVSPLTELHEQWKNGISGRFGNGSLKPASASSGQPTFSVLSAATESNAASNAANAVSWEALPLTIRETDKPYLVELDYPAEIPQTLEIGIVELLNYGDKTIPVLTKNSGIHIIEEIVSDQQPDRMATHRLLFWAKTKQPMLLLVNRDRQRSAQFGDVRLYQIGSPNTAANTANVSEQKAEIPLEIPKPFDGKPERIVLGYLHRADFLEELNSSTEFCPARTPIRPTNWQFPYESSIRMITALQQSGYDGAIVNTVSNEAMLYPSKKMKQSGDDGGVPPTSPALCKDIFELLARLFDREQLTLIPAIDFNFPIPELENRIQANPALAEELLWTSTDQTGEPRYNLLHPAVQQALLGIVQELVEKYSKHPSFGGVTVLLTPSGSARLPLIHRELDDRTFSQFQQDVQNEGLIFPPELTATDTATRQQRKAARAVYVQSDPKAWDAWRRWRIRCVQNFYAEVTKTVTEKRPDAKLYLTAGTILDTPEIRSYCQPSLSRWPSPVYVLQMLGFDPMLLAETPSLVFLRPHRVSEIPESLETACYAEFDAAETGNHFSKNGLTPGVLFYHDSPFVPAEYHNRRRFVKQLTQSDVAMFIDGGRMFPCGEENAVYDLLATFRQLPAFPFETFFKNEKSLQPLTVRFANTLNGLVVYLVNDAPFSISADLTFSAVSDVQLSELSGRRAIDPMTVHNGRPTWQIAMKPFDLVAIVLNDPNAAILNVDVKRPSAICGVNGILRQKVDQLSRQIHAANGGILWDKLGNPDFEAIEKESKNAKNSAEMTGWQRFGSPTFSAQLDSEFKNSGLYSLKLSETIGNNQTETGMVLSEPFEAPATGQIFVTVFIGIADSITEKQGALPLDVVLSAKQRSGEPLFLSYRVEPALLPLLVQAPSNNGVRWHKLIIPFDQLPTSGLEDFRIGFRLFAPGTVWIDNVTLYRMTFTSNEIKVLQQLVLVANGRCSADRVSDLLTILEGYWPQYLFRHVPMPLISTSPSVAVAAKVNVPYTSQVSPPTLPPAAPLPKKEEQSIFNRVKSWFSK